jgi:cytochrome P450
VVCAFNENFFVNLLSAGFKFAMLELKLVVARLVQKYDFSMPEGAVVRVVEEGSLRPEGKLVMNWSRRKQ